MGETMQAYVRGYKAMQRELTNEYVDNLKESIQIVTAILDEGGLSGDDYIFYVDILTQDKRELKKLTEARGY